MSITRVPDVLPLSDAIGRRFEYLRLSLTEVAERLGITEAAAKSRLLRARPPAGSPHSKCAALASRFATHPCRSQRFNGIGSS